MCVTLCALGDKDLDPKVSRMCSTLRKEYLRKEQIKYFGMQTSQNPVG